MMYKAIMILLDGSRQGEAIIPYVVALAQPGDAKVILLRVIEPLCVIAGSEGTNPVPDGEMLEQEAHNAKSYLNEIQTRLHETGISAEQRLAFGSVGSTTTDLAKQEGVDLIVMSRRAPTGLGQEWRKSGAAGVLHSSDCPVLLVSPPETVIHSPSNPPWLLLGRVT